MTTNTILDSLVNWRGEVLRLTLVNGMQFQGLVEDDLTPLSQTLLLSRSGDQNEVVVRLSSIVAIEPLGAPRDWRGKFTTNP